MRTYLRVSGTLFGSWLWTVRLLPTAATLLAAGPLPDSAYQGFRRRSHHVAGNSRS